MKFDKKSPRAWLYFLISILNIFLAFLISKFLRPKKRNKIIILFGHKLNGNIETFLNFFREKKPKGLEIFYLTIDCRYYKSLKKKGIEVLSPQKLKDIMKVLDSDVFVSTHGSSIFSILKKINPSLKFIDVWHGIAYKWCNLEEIRSYDRFFVSSKFMKDLYVNDYHFKSSKVKITGFSRVDPLVIKNKLNRQKILDELNIRNSYKKIVLFAPTWRQIDKNRSVLPFAFKAENFLGRVNKFGRTNNILFIFRTHLNTKLKINREFEKYKNVIFVSVNDFPLAYQLLYVVDTLVTDWSSIAVDYLVLNRPTIFLDVAPPFKEHTLGPEDRAGYLVKNFNELMKTIKLALDNPQDYKNKFQQLRKRVIEKAYSNTLDGKSSERYLREIKLILRR